MAAAEMGERAEFAGGLTRVLVCGSNYGAVYLRAIADASDLVAVGLLARGSLRSSELSSRHGLPLYRNVSELPESIDIACAALDSSANALVLELVERGLHVLCEHPRSASFLGDALLAARRRGTCFHVNGHFADLPAPRTFIDECLRVASEDDPPVFVDAWCADRGLWAALDILARSGIGLDPETPVRAEDVGPFARILGRAVGRPIDLRVQPGGSLVDGSPEYLVDCRLSVGFAGGTLTLLSVAGPVVWNVNVNRGPGGGRQLWTQAEASAPTAVQLSDARTAANRRAIEHIVRQSVDRGIVAGQEPEFLTPLARAWDAVGSLLQAS